MLRIPIENWSDKELRNILYECDLFAWSDGSLNQEDKKFVQALLIEIKNRENEKYDEGT